MDLTPYIREVPNFPRVGSSFIDLGRLFQDPKAFRFLITRMADAHRRNPPDVVAAIETRGFLLGAALAGVMGAGIVAIRKPRRLPGDVFREEFSSENDRNAVLEIQKDAFRPGQRVVVVDDILATGSTMAAATRLLSNFNIILLGATVILELSHLNGRDKLSTPVLSFIRTAPAPTPTAL